MKNAQAIRKQVENLLDRAKVARQAIQKDVEGMNFPKVDDEVRNAAMRQWAKMDGTVEALYEVLHFIDGPVV